MSIQLQPPAAADEEHPPPSALNSSAVSAHAVAWVMKHAGAMPRDRMVLVNVSGRGDKDVVQVAALEGVSL